MFSKIISKNSKINLDSIKSKNINILVNNNASLLAYGNKFNCITFILKKNTILNFYFFLSNCSKIKIILEDSNAKAYIRGVSIINRKLNLNILQEHKADNTKSEFIFKTLLLKNSNLTFNGKVFVEKNKKNVFIKQINKNILLTKNLHLTYRPILNILTKDTFCNHGSTFSTIKEQDLFYLKSRGLSSIEAKNYFFKFFFRDVVPKGDKMNFLKRMTRV